jgi:hypothetical protein
MSYYKDFLHELPKRSLSLLEKYYTTEKNSEEPGYDVTLLISLAMPVFVITSEVIKTPYKQVSSASKELEGMLNTKTTSSGIFGNISKDWKYSMEVDSKPEAFESLPFDRSLIDTEQSQLSVLSQIRNALAHGNIKFTKKGNNQIDTILLYAEKRRDKEFVGYHVHLIPVADFYLLLKNWCTFLKGKDVLTYFQELDHAA